MHGGGFDHDHFAYHRHLICVFVNGAPCWYPVYTAYPYYYDAPSPVMSSSADYSSDSGYVPPMDTSNTQAASDYGDLGLSWGQDLRREVVTWDQFVAYLRASIVTAPPSAPADRSSRGSRPTPPPETGARTCGNAAPYLNPRARR